MAKKKAEESVHVRIERPVGKRKAVLQTAISAVELLKRYDKIKELHKEKEKAQLDFRKKLRSIHYLLRQIRFKELPLDLQELENVRTVAGKKLVKIPKPLAKKKVAKRVKKKKVAKKKKVGPQTIDEQLASLRAKMNKL